MLRELSSIFSLISRSSLANPYFLATVQNRKSSTITGSSTIVWAATNCSLVDAGAAPSVVPSAVPSGCSAAGAATGASAVFPGSSWVVEGSSIPPGVSPTVSSEPPGTSVPSPGCCPGVSVPSPDSPGWSVPSSGWPGVSVSPPDSPGPGVTSGSAGISCSTGVPSSFSVTYPFSSSTYCQPSGRV